MDMEDPCLLTQRPLRSETGDLLFGMGYWFVWVGIPHSRDTLSRALFMVGSQEAETMIKKNGLPPQMS